MTDTILVVEDETDIAELIQVHMEDLSMDTTLCGDGNQAIELALSRQFEVIILDINLPGCNGLDVCRKVREAKPEQAIMMLTSRTSEIDRVVGLEVGADDYMTKPFSVRELQARVHAMMRRVKLLESRQRPVSDNKSAICIGDLMIDMVSHQVVLRDQSLDLTVTEFDLLTHMAKHPGQVFSRSQLLDSVWGYQHSGYEHTVNSHINRLRNKLVPGQTGEPIIQTVFGVGYKLNPKGVDG